MNPRVMQNYGEESLIGHMAKIWAATANGRYERVVQISVLGRYLVGFDLRLSTERAR